MSGKGQRIDMHFFHINGQKTGGLGAVHHEAQPVGCGKFPRLPQRLDRAADIADVGQHQQLRTALQKLRQRGKDEGAVGAAGNAGECDAGFLQLPERAHDSIVLHGRGDHMIPRLQKALQNVVQGLRDVSGEDHVSGIFAVKQIIEKTTGVIDQLLRGIGIFVTAPTGAGAAAGHVLIYRSCHLPGLREAGAGVVQVDPGILRLLFCFLIHWFSFDDCRR